MYRFFSKWITFRFIFIDTYWSSILPRHHVSNLGIRGMVPVLRVLTFLGAQSDQKAILSKDTMKNQKSKSKSGYRGKIP